MTQTIPKKASCIAQSLTGVVVSPNTETNRRECGSVEVAYDVERVGPMSGLLEVKQQYIASILCIIALSNNKDEIRLKTTFFVDVSLFIPQRSFSQVYFHQYSIVYFIFCMLHKVWYFGIMKFALLVVGNKVNDSLIDLFIFVVIIYGVDETEGYSRPRRRRHE